MIDAQTIVNVSYLIHIKLICQRYDTLTIKRLYCSWREAEIISLKIFITDSFGRGPVFICISLFSISFSLAGS